MRVRQLTVKQFKSFINGTPVQQGSMKAFPIRRANGTLGVSMVHNKGNQLSAWREQIRVSFLEKYPELTEAVKEGGYFKQHTPVNLYCCFYLNKPKSNKLRMPSNKKADLDKLVRAVNDALSGILFFDDCQVVNITAEKKWVVEDLYPEGVFIKIEEA